MSPEREAIAAVWRHKQAALALAGAALALAVLALAWFWIPDSTVAAAALSFLVGLVVIVATLWLTGAALLFYRQAHAGEEARLGPAFRVALRRLPALALWLALLVFALGWLARWRGVWIAAPLLLVPLAGSVSAEGFRGFFRRAWRLRYFPGAALLLAAGCWLPYLLWHWHAPLSGVVMETTSLVVRLALAYLVAIGSWLALSSLVGRLHGGATPARSPSAAP